eukprot:m.287491 g.287491  ORF g.287491 m.287491 type:complete len:214 (+) comp16362_c1_seq18:380-1021(+)
MDYQSDKPYQPVDFDNLPQPPPPPPVGPSPSPLPLSSKKKCCQCQCTSIKCPSEACEHRNRCVGATMEGFFCTMNRKSTKPNDKRLRHYLCERAGLENGQHMKEVLIPKGKYKDNLLAVIPAVVLEKTRISLQQCSSSCYHSSLCVERWIPKKRAAVDWPEPDDITGNLIANTLVEQQIMNVQFKSDMVVCGCHFSPDEVIVVNGKFRPQGFD